MHYISYRDNPNINRDVTPLFLSSFPEDERPSKEDFYLSINRCKDNHLFAFYENDIFVGFTFIVIHNDICYILFLAVVEELRNQGKGKEIINILKEEYKDYRLLILYEEVNQKYDNYELRKRRKNFYYRLGFKNNILKTSEYGVIYESCYIGNKPINFIEYKELFKKGFGEESLKYLKEVND